jgi:hypothetical protein
MRSWWKFRKGETMPNTLIVHYIFTVINEEEEPLYVTTKCLRTDPWESLAFGIGSPRIMDVTCEECAKGGRNYDR